MGLKWPPPWPPKKLQRSAGLIAPSQDPNRSSNVPSAMRTKMVDATAATPAFAIMGSWLSAACPFIPFALECVHVASTILPQGLPSYMYLPSLAGDWDPDRAALPSEPLASPCFVHSVWCYQDGLMLFNMSHAGHVGVSCSVWIYIYICNISIQNHTRYLYHM